MPVISFFSAAHCRAEEVVSLVCEQTGFSILKNEQLLRLAAGRFGTDERKLQRAMYGPRPFFDSFTRERERHVAYLKVALAELIQDDDLAYHGFAGHLLPASLRHVLRVCLVGQRQFRLQQVANRLGLSESEAGKLLDREDEKCKQWTLHLFGLGPWDKRLYDLVIPTDSTTVEEAAREIVANASKPVVASTDGTRAAARDFWLASRVEVVLTEAGHQVDVECRNGQVTLIINKYVMRLEKYKREISDLASGIEGVVAVEAKVGPNYHQPTIYPKLDLPRKILLVDDEKEFVHTLSERLQTRNLESAVAYDGEQALQIVANDAPDVMVLDLKMPGIDGLEVLRKIKQDHPRTEVIILTGHGSETEKKLARELGAFAYLQKPVDVDLLARTMKEAYQVASAGQATTDDGD